MHLSFDSAISYQGMYFTDASAHLSVCSIVKCLKTLSIVFNSKNLENNLNVYLSKKGQLSKYWYMHILLYSYKQKQKE